MKKINDIKKIIEFENKYKISSYFETDISQHMAFFHFERNDYILKEGEPFTHLYFFLEGKAKIYKTLSNGKALLLCFYHDFNILGEVELFHSDYFKTNVQAINDVYCIGIPVNIVRNLLLEDRIFLKNICHFLAEKLNRLSTNSTINLLYPLENRLASYIVSTTEETVNDKDKSLLIFNENLTELSELLGTSYRHLLRTLYHFCNTGVLKKDKNSYLVMDEKKLQLLASDLYK